MKLRSAILKILPFWIFALIFKLGAGLHYTLLSPLGERVFPEWMVGAFIGGGAFIQMLLDVPAGYILDRFGYVRVLKISSIFFFAAAACLLFGLTKWTYIATILLSTASWLFFGPGIDAYILSSAKKEFAGRFISLRDVTESAGIVIGTAIFPFIVHFNSSMIGTILLILLGAGMLALFYAPLDQHFVHAEKKIATQGYYIRRHYLSHLFQTLKKLNPVSTILLLSNFSAATFYGIIWFVVPLLIAESDRSGALGFGLGVFDLAILLGGFLLGHLTDRWDKRWLIFFGLLLFTLCATFIGFRFDFLFLILGFLATTGDEMSSISLWAWLDHLDKNHAEDALISGTISFAQDIGWSIGPILAGALFTLVGPSWTIASGSLFILCTWIIACIFLRRTPVLGQHDPERHYPRHKRHKR